MAVEKRFTQTGIIFPAGSSARAMFKSSSQNDRPNDFLSLRYGHVVVSAAAAIGPSPAASISASKIGLAVLILVALCPIYPAELGSTSPQVYHGRNIPTSQAARANTLQAIGQPAAKAASKELPSELQVALPVSQGSQLGLQAGKWLSSHQQLPRAAVPSCQCRAAPECAISWVRFFFYF